MEPEVPTASELVVPTSRASLIHVAISSGTFVVGGACLVYVAERLDLEGVPQAARLIVSLVGLTTIIFFGAGGAYALFRIKKPTPAVIVDQNGILDNASAVGVGFIAWGEIDELREYRFLKQVFLGIVPKNGEDLLRRLPAWKRVLIRANRLTGTPPINIPQSMLTMSVPQLMREMEKRSGVRADA
jgi:hypothetical protein